MFRIQIFYRQILLVKENGKIRDVYVKEMFRDILPPEAQQDQEEKPAVPSMDLNPWIVGGITAAVVGLYAFGIAAKRCLFG